MLLFSCYQPTAEQKPVLSEQQLIPILKEIHLAEALLTEITNRHQKDSMARYYYHQILQQHEVEFEDFEQSMHAYFTQASALDSLYQKVIVTLSEERKDFEAKQKTKLQNR